MVCHGTEDNDIDVEDYVACETCSQWIHAKCIPCDHPCSPADDNFYCPHCIL